MAELERLLKAETGQRVVSDSGAKSETASATISADLWRQLKPGSLVLAAGFDKNDNLDGWWEAIIVRVDDGEFLVRWRDEPNEPKSSRSQEYIALLHLHCTTSWFATPSRGLSRKTGFQMRLSNVIGPKAGWIPLPSTLFPIGRTGTWGRGTGCHWQVKTRRAN